MTTRPGKIGGQALQEFAVTTPFGRTGYVCEGTDPNANATSITMFDDRVVIKHKNGRTIEYFRRHILTWDFLRVGDSKL